MKYQVNNDEEIRCDEKEVLKISGCYTSIRDNFLAKAFVKILRKVLNYLVGPYFAGPKWRYFL